MAVAAKYVKLVIEQNADFGFTIKYRQKDGTPISLDSATMQVRPKAGAAVTVELSTSNGKLVIAGAGTNEITAALSPTETLALPAGNYFYDLIALETVSGLQRRLIQGPCEISAAVTA